MQPTICPTRCRAIRMQRVAQEEEHLMLRTHSVAAARWLLLTSLLAACDSGWPRMLVAQDILLEPRRHGDGPLSAKDFQATPPQPEAVKSDVNKDFHLALRL